jgi:hypothetical protein
VSAIVSNATALTNLTYSDRGTRYRTIGLNADGSLIGYDSTAAVLVKSIDDGASWSTLCSFVFPYNQVNGVVLTADGEVLANLGAKNDGTTGGSIWKSSGWAANPLTATFTKTLDLGATKPAAYFSSAYGGLSAAGALVLATEYGPKTSSSPLAASALESHLSTDYGATWSTVFNLATSNVDGAPVPVSTSTDNHLHGGLVDPIWDRLWIMFGDNRSSGTPSYAGIIYSDDHGATWSSVPGTLNTAGTWQGVAPFSLTSRVVMLSDHGTSGVWHIPRASYRNMNPIQPISIVSASSFLGRLISRRRPTDPVIASVVGLGDPCIGKIVVSWDEQNWYVAYSDPNSIGGGANSVGLQGAWGPTNTGKLVAEFSDSTRFANGARMTATIPAAP